MQCRQIISISWPLDIGYASKQLRYYNRKIATIDHFTGIDAYEDKLTIHFLAHIVTE